MESPLLDKLKQFKKKYFLNLLIKSLLIFFLSVLGIYLFINALEYLFHFNSVIRSILFYSLTLSFIGLFIYYIIIPFWKLMNSNNILTDEEAARKVGENFPYIKDKLLNIIQLYEKSKNNELARASINALSKNYKNVNFKEAINLKANTRYVKYVSIPLITLLVILLFSPQFITNSTTRIIDYSNEYKPVAPFAFKLINDDLNAFYNEDFKVMLRYQGEPAPNETFIVVNDRRIKMRYNEDGIFTHNFLKIQRPKSFYFNASGFNSSTYDLSVSNRPNIKDFNVELLFPGYTNKKNETIKNSGNLVMPEGTQVNWNLSTTETDSIYFQFLNSGDIYKTKKLENGIFELTKSVYSSDVYLVNLKNELSTNKDKIQYTIDVIKDEFPNIELEVFKDTVFYESVIIGGSVSDDYGLNTIELKYRSIDNNDGGFNSIAISFNKNQNNQSLFYDWQVDSILSGTQSGIEFFVRVTDNDGVNGSKSTRSQIYTFKIPSKREISKALDRDSEKTEQQINKSLSKAKEINNQLKKVKDRLKGKKNLEWQDERILQDLIKKRQEIQEDIADLKKQNDSFNKKNERFNDQSEQIKEKSEQLKELMDELLDEKTRALYKELQKLLEENKDVSDVQEMLEKIDESEDNLEKELERAIELFKKLKYESKLDEVIKDVEEQAEEQKEISEKTLDKNQNLEELEDQQDKLNKEFESVEKSLEELEEMNKELKNPTPTDDMSEEMNNIKNEQKKSSENLSKGKRKKANQSQEKSSQQMQKMKQKLQNMQMNMEMATLSENLNNLRDIEDNLLKLSFHQEEVLGKFRNLNVSDPQFVNVSQEQIKLMDDAKIIEDSLFALAERVFQLKSFVTREVNKMNKYMDEASDAIKERRRGMALSKQQFAMTSMNNLALMLNDVLQNMQMQMSDAMGKPQDGQQKKGMKMPSLSNLQQQLNKKIEELKRSGKNGRSLSEELAKLAAEQEKIRRRLSKEKGKLEQINEGKAGNKLGEIIEKMEETELDLVNKQITKETIERQKEILTRLLKSEDALREQEMDKKRKGETAKEKRRDIPPEFEEYIKLKKQEIELLKTVPIKLNQFYKQEVNKYFLRLSDQTDELN